ncbi:MAG: tetratricopeptide repeat protein [Candidatus Binatia bacterium]
MTASPARTLGTFALLTLVVGAIYGRALPAPFIFDDRLAIVENPSLLRLWPLVGDAHERGPLNPPPLAPTARRPLPNWTLAVDRHFYGLEPAGYRVTNLVLHTLTATVLAVLVEGSLLLPYFGGVFAGVAAPLALATALVWAVHPLVTEAVVYVTQRTELLAAFFYLVTLCAALRHWTAPSASAARAWLVVAIACCWLGMASKEVMASAPFVVALYQRTFLVDSWRALRRSTPLYVGLASSWLLLIGLSVGGIGGLADARHHVAPLVWWATQTKIVLLYLELTLWPWPLAIHYAPNFLRTFGAAWPWLVAFTVVAATIVAAVWRRPAARFVVIAAVLVLAPTLVVPLPKMIAAERRMYVPLAGLVALAVVGGHRWLVARGGRGRLEASVAAALVLLLAGVSVVRLAAYDTVESIWRDTVRRQPDDPMAHYNLGVALLDAGRPPAETLPSFEEALRLDPDYPSALDNLGMALNKLDRSEEARRHLERALVLDPDDVVALNNLGIALTRTGHAEQALAPLSRALELQPDQPKVKVHVNLANALLALGRVDDAIGHLERAVALAPDDVDARYNLGGALMRAGRTLAAIVAFEAVLTLAPDDGETQNNLGSALLGDGQTDRAIAVFRRALGQRPDNANVLANLGTALLVAGRRDEAMTQLEAALRVSPAHLNAQRNLASALLDAGRPGEAVAHFERAVRLDPNDAVSRFRCALAYEAIGRRDDALPLARAALVLAQEQGQAAFAAEITAWLSSR